MIIRSLSIQSHDNLGAGVFKLMIISVCCIQTQLIVFMPNAARIHKGAVPVRRGPPSECARAHLAPDKGYNTHCHTLYTLVYPARGPSLSLLLLLGWHPTVSRPSLSPFITRVAPHRVSTP